MTENYIEQQQFINNNQIGNFYYQKQQEYQDKNWSKEDFEIGPSLGKGKFSEVFIAKDKQSGYIVALKILQKHYVKEMGLEVQLKREILLQNSCDHKNILQIYGFFHDEKCIYLILEYAEQGDLYSLANQFEKKRIPEKMASAYIYQAINALLYMHEKKIIHRDLKPENLLISKGEIKLADFGLAINFNEKSSEKRITFCGTLDYISPEMFTRKGHDFKIDVWSIGILAYELISGRPPFESDTYEETMSRVCKQQINFPNYFSNDLKYFLQNILVKDPQKRPNLKELLEYNWIKQNK